MLDDMRRDIPVKLLKQAQYQGGLVTRKQAVAAGLSPDKVAWLLKRGAWRPVCRGVYATFTGPVSREARRWAAVLYAGDGAYLSHETAAQLNRLTDDESPAIHVTIPANRRVSPPDGVLIHLSSRKPMVWRPPGIPPYTVAARTVIDLMETAADEEAVIALVARGFSQRMLSEADLRGLTLTCKKLRWRRDLGEIISMTAGGAHSLLEYRHDRDVQRAHGLPEPVKQARFRKPDGSWGYRDRCYPEYGGLVIELDGKRFHSGDQRRRDTERDNQAAVAGATLRYGWDGVTRGACETAKQEAAALRNRGWTGTLRSCSPRCRAVPGAPSAKPARRSAEPAGRRG
jgi:hypothetical protein